MQRVSAKDLAGPVDWSGPTFPPINNAEAKLRWINRPFRWHRNDGPELFVVLDGVVDMHVRTAQTGETITRLSPGEMLLIEEGEEHIAYPQGEARVLVVEQAESGPLERPL